MELTSFADVSFPDYVTLDWDDRGGGGEIGGIGTQSFADVSFPDYVTLDWDDRGGDRGHWNSQVLLVFLSLIM